MEGVDVLGVIGLAAQGDLLALDKRERGEFDAIRQRRADVAQTFQRGPNRISILLQEPELRLLLPHLGGRSFQECLFVLQLGGDVKVEMNLEYRFTIYKYIKGAMFTDAGNVWLLKSNPSNEGSFFVFNRFLKEMAVDAGVGLRIDVSFFVLRFDLAIPLRKPWLDQSRRWVFDKIMFMNNVWRRENLVLNVAIGYPF